MQVDLKMTFDISGHFKTLIVNLTLLFITSIPNVSSIMERTKNSFLFENTCNISYYSILNMFTRPQLLLNIWNIIFFWDI